MARSIKYLKALTKYGGVLMSNGSIQQINVPQEIITVAPTQIETPRGEPQNSINSSQSQTQTLAQIAQTESQAEIPGAQYNKIVHATPSVQSMESNPTLTVHKFESAWDKVQQPPGFTYKGKATWTLQILIPHRRINHLLCNKL